MDIWNLNISPVISPTIATRIRSAFPKVATLSDLLAIPRVELSQRSGITLGEVDSIVNAIKEEQQREAKSLISLIQEETAVPVLHLGDPILDAFLGDSVLKQDLTLINGPPGSGKTQLVYTILTKAIMQKKTCLYINGGCNFVLDRIVNLLRVYNASPEECFHYLYLEHGNNPMELYDILEKFESVGKFQVNAWGCIVIDSITPFFQSLSNQEQLNGRSLLTHILHHLRQVSRHYHIPILLTNQTRRNVEQKMKNALSTDINYCFDTCINLGRFENEKVMQVMKASAHMTPCFIPITISERGVEGVRKESVEEQTVQ